MPLCRAPLPRRFPAHSGIFIFSPRLAWEAAEIAIIDFKVLEVGVSRLFVDSSLEIFVSLAGEDLELVKLLGVESQCVLLAAELKVVAL
jgi:hypothetical protein